MIVGEGVWLITEASNQNYYQQCAELAKELKYKKIGKKMQNFEHEPKPIKWITSTIYRGSTSLSFCLLTILIYHSA